MALDEDQKKCGGIVSAGGLCTLTSIAMIVVGCISIDFEDTTSLTHSDGVSSDCYLKHQIPYYLLVGGCLNIVLMILRIIFQRGCRKCAELGENNKFCSTLAFAGKFSCITFYDIIALILIVIWLVIGSNWVIGVYDERTSSNCPGYVYWFAFACIVAGWIFVTFAIVCGLLVKFCTCFWDLICCKPCKNAGSNNAV